MLDIRGELMRVATAMERQRAYVDGLATQNMPADMVKCIEAAAALRIERDSLERLEAEYRKIFDRFVSEQAT